ncbi:alkaline phosphatase family protein [Alkalitalea saponilacus]|uniref:Type I phosphodiesterase / nucleotide pyrophosphatase n=1 Tax=Alkalitalea saponilacus TaxID=889453 RepID=A0A1T5AT69_9BACT|nr:alkaline phosphatase family protein [Alkalitalea saponilacus]ASB48604.1 hypothetical protein CDL62_05345 [Alkalitalea saponilacus]SKB38115.1 Type I phosphodiesterase / nucleotide pyrophosphatase [Alkalitalea saponilacus]
MMRLLWWFLLVILPFFSLKAEKTEAPGLIIFLVIDELDNEQILLLQREFSSQGINRISRTGMRFMNAYTSDISGYPGTRIASLYSGTSPSTHGLIGETWVNRRNNQFIQPASYDSAQIPTVLSYNQSKTIADYLKSVYGSEAKNATISVNAPWLIHANGYSPDHIFTYDQNRGFFYDASNPGKKDDWMNSFNQSINNTNLLNRQWGPVKDITSYVEFRYLPDEKRKDFRSFLYNMRTGTEAPFSRIAGSPYINTLIRDFTVSFLANTGFGKSSVPNLLTIQFTTRPFTKTNGTILPAEKEDMLLRLDQDIASLLTFLDFEFGRDNYLLVLTAGANSMPDQTTTGKAGITTGTVEFRRVVSLLNLYLMAQYGQGQWVTGIHDNFLYLNHQLIEENQLELEVIQEKTCRFLVEFSGIKHAISVWNKIFNSEKQPVLSDNLFSRRLPDIYIELLPGWSTPATSLGTRQTGKSGNNFVPLFVSGTGIRDGAWITPFNINKLTPILLQLYGINHPELIYMEQVNLFK